MKIVKILLLVKMTLPLTAAMREKEYLLVVIQTEKLRMLNLRRKRKLHLRKANLALSRNCLVWIH